MKKQDKYVVYKWYQNKVFNPKKNKFELAEPTRHQRPMTNEEIQIKKRDTFWTWFNFFGCIIFFTIGIISTMSLAVMGDSKIWVAFGWWCLGGVGLTAAYFIFYFCVGKQQEEKYDKKLDRFSDWGFEIFDLIHEEQAERQSAIAKEWREKHRLEEAIRIAQETKNCNDIAELARLFAGEIRGDK